MSTQPFDPARYKAGQRREWDAAASGLKYWWQVAEPALQPVSERMMELADIQPGQRVLDVATGIGEPAVTAARRVGPSGHVIATDLSPQMLALGRERVAELGLPPYRFPGNGCRDAGTAGTELRHHSLPVWPDVFARSSGGIGTDAYSGSTNSDSKRGLCKIQEGA